MAPTTPDGNRHHLEQLPGSYERWISNLGAPAPPGAEYNVTTQISAMVPIAFYSYQIAVTALDLICWWEFTLSLY
jgi:hypothetical protein